MRSREPRWIDALVDGKKGMLCRMQDAGCRLQVGGWWVVGGGAWGKVWSVEVCALFGAAGWLSVGEMRGRIK